MELAFKRACACARCFTLSGKEIAVSCRSELRRRRKKLDLVFRRGLFHVEERGRVRVRPPRSLSCKLREMSCLHANHHCTVHDDATARHIMLYDFISIHGPVSLTSRVPLKENTCVKISTTSALLVETVLNNIRSHRDRRTEALVFS